MSDKCKLFQGWEEWCCDVNWLDYGGTWYRRLSKSRFHFIVLHRWDESDERELNAKYCIDLNEIDLAKIPKKEQRSALESCGQEYAVRDEFFNLIKAGCCNDSGAKAPLDSVNTNNAWQTVRELKRLSREVEQSTRKHKEMMARPVNRIGSTAEEYMTGDLNSAILRGLDEGRPEADLLARMGCLR